MSLVENRTSASRTAPTSAAPAVAPAPLSSPSSSPLASPSAPAASYKGEAAVAKPARLPKQSNPHRKTAEVTDERRRWQRSRYARGIDWPILFWLVAIHVGALAAPFTFTWQGLAVMFVLGWISGGIGICLGYHRLLTHQSFKTYRPVRWLIAWLGGLAGQGSAVHWVANHRKHHALSDQHGDPHSPIDGAWWSHMLWFLPRVSGQAYVDYNQRWAPDLARDRVLVFLDRTFLLWHVLMGAVLYAVGYWLGGTSLALSLLVWGLFLRLVWVLHSTWLVNSATHMWGYRNYDTTDHSRNLWWVALMTYGEGWHNNHHAYPRMARHGHKWWEFDVTFATIRLLEKLGLAWDVVDNQHAKSTQN